MKDSLFYFPIRIHYLKIKGSKYIVEKTDAEVKQGLSAAITRTARSGTATTTGANWFYRGDTESRTWTGVNIVDGNFPTGG